MNTLRLSRSSGFGFRPPQSFEGDVAPLRVGTAANSRVKYDPAWDKGVAARQAVLEWSERGWVWRELAGQTLLDGGLLKAGDEVLIDGVVEVELSPGGPKLRLEAEAAREPEGGRLASVAGTHTVEAPAPFEAFPAGSQDREWAARQRLLTGVIGVTLLAVAGFAVWWWGFREAKQGDIWALPAAPVAEVPQEPETSGAAKPETKPETKADRLPGSIIPPSLTDEEREMVETLKRNDGLHAAIMEYWRAQGASSPYVKAILGMEDFWLAKQAPWMVAFRKSNGRKTLRGMDFPGVFVPEVMHGNVQGLGIPVLPVELAEQVAVAVAETPSDEGQGQAIAGLSAGQRGKAGGARVDKTELLKQWRAYSVKGQRVNTQLTETAEMPKAWAVMVGINRFEMPEGWDSGSANLAGCRNDVGVLAKVLMTQGIFTPERTVLLTDAQKDSPRYPRKVNVVAALSEVVRQAGPSDVIYIAFSTHGGFDTDKKDTGLMMVDSLTGGSDFYGEELLKILQEAKAKNILISMDACQTGGMGSLGGSQGALANRQASRERMPIPEGFYQRLGASRGHVVIRACRADQSTPDVLTLGHGLLSCLMVAGLSGEADADNDGVVTLSELRIYITTAIPKISRREMEIAAENGGPAFDESEVLQPTFTSSSFGEAGDLPLTVVEKKATLWGVGTGKAEGSGSAATGPAAGEGKSFEPRRLIIKWKAEVSDTQMSRTRSAFNVRQVSRLPKLGKGRLEIVEVPPGKTAEEVAKEYEKSGLVEFVEVDRQVQAQAAPNDPFFVSGDQWGLANRKKPEKIRAQEAAVRSWKLSEDRALIQPVKVPQTQGREGSPPTADADAAGPDIRAVRGWERQNDAKPVVVAVVDSGVRYTHQDLAANMWRNPGETPGNGIDDDGNGVVDDLHGYNAITGSGDPMDDNGHGTHVGGIIGAVGNNGVGISGVAWQAQLMAVKVLGANCRGSNSDILMGYEYAARMGASVINASLGAAREVSLAETEVFSNLRDAGIVFVTAAGNDSCNNDEVPVAPAGASVMFDNVISVGSVNLDGKASDFSNFGKTTVALYAPGSHIWSTWFTGDNLYLPLDGTSMATPFVTGAVALLKARSPVNESPGALRARLIQSVRPLPDLVDKCVSGGMLDLDALLKNEPAALLKASN